MDEQAAGAVRRGRPQHLRRASTIVYVTVFVPVAIGFTALSVDIGRLCVAKTELQRAADAAAHAAAWELLDEDRMDETLLYQVLEQARYQARDAAAANTVLTESPYVDPYADVEIGRLNDFTDQTEPMSFDDPSSYNAVSVIVQRSAERNGSVVLYFAPLLGFRQKDLTAQATAGFEDGIDGFEVTEWSDNADLLPFSIKSDSWAALLAGGDDNYTYDPETGIVSAGSDGIPELNIFPGSGGGQLPPGNFGTVDIGSPNNSTADLARQIVEGVNADDLSYLGGRLELGDDGYVDLNGDTGVSAGVKDELESIKGQPRAIPIFSSVWGRGNNSTFRVTAFGGIRIMNVKLTGPMRHKELVVQPAFVVDSAALPKPGSSSSYFIYRPVQIVR